MVIVSWIFLALVAIAVIATIIRHKAYWVVAILWCIAVIFGAIFIGSKLDMCTIEIIAYIVLTLLICTIGANVFIEIDEKVNK